MNFKGLSLPGYKVGFVMKGDGSEGEVIGSNPQLTKKLTINNQHLPNCNLVIGTQAFDFGCKRAQK